MTSSDNPNSTTEDERDEQSNSPRKRKRRFALWGLVGVVVVAGILFGLYHFLVGRWYESTDDAYVSGNVVQITPRVPGTVISIGADDNDYVHKGEVLVRLDPSTTGVKLQHAEAALAQTVRKVRGLYSRVHSSQADIAVREAALKQARADYDRRKGLAASGAISAEKLSHAHEALVTAENALAAARAQRATTEAPVADTRIAQQADVKAAAANVRAAWLFNQRTTLVAPVSGYVAKRSVQVGQRVKPGTPLMAVVPLNKVWVDANFKETQLTDMRIGQAVTLTSGVYGGSVTYDGRIFGLGIGTGSAFSLLPAQNASGNWIKIVQRLPVRIALDPRELKTHPLRIGMSMDAKVNLHNQSGPMLSTRSPRHPVLGTDVFSHSEAAVDTLIAQIIQANDGTGSGAAHTASAHSSAAHALVQAAH